MESREAILFVGGARIELAGIPKEKAFTEPIVTMTVPADIFGRGIRNLFHDRPPEMKKAASDFRAAPRSSVLSRGQPPRSSFFPKLAGHIELWDSGFVAYTMALVKRLCERIGWCSNETMILRVGTVSCFVKNNL